VRGTEELPVQGLTAPHPLQDQVAIVTGGSSGIGRAVCQVLARAGAHVVVVGRDRTHVNHTIAELDSNNTSITTLGLPLDVGCEEDMEELRHQTLARFGRIDILVAAAGIWRGTKTATALPATVATMSVSEWDEVVRTNLRGVFLSNRTVVPVMMRQKSGTIINLSSARGGLYGHPYASAYCASKFGIIGLSQALAHEARSYGVKVYSVLPDIVDTPMLGLLGRAQLGASLPPERVAELILHLLTLPPDTVLMNPLIAPFLNQDRLLGVNEIVLRPR
jgi:NAD(P)-dependent dehydrogenase (short-subunit alcohol dehydrogenase family)